MKEEAQRIAIAEACGWTRIMASPGFASDDTFPRGVEPRKQTMASFRALPDYLNDLNAMHEAEKALSREEGTGGRARDQWNLYVWFIYEVVTGHPWESDTNDYPGDVLNATAAQRAEAFLKTIGKWVDSP